MRIKDLPKHKQTKKWIESEIKYEKHKGVHTYHQCSCGRMACRSERCALCWKDLLNQLKSIKESK